MCADSEGKSESETTDTIPSPARTTNLERFLDARRRSEKTVTSPTSSADELARKLFPVLRGDPLTGGISLRVTNGDKSSSRAGLASGSRGSGEEQQMKKRNDLYQAKSEGKLRRYTIPKLSQQEQLQTCSLSTAHTTTTTAAATSTATAGHYHSVAPSERQDTTSTILASYYGSSSRKQSRSLSLSDQGECAYRCYSERRETSSASNLLDSLSGGAYACLHSTSSKEKEKELHSGYDGHHATGTASEECGTYTAFGAGSGFYNGLNRLSEQVTPSILQPASSSLCNGSSRPHEQVKVESANASIPSFPARLATKQNPKMVIRRALDSYFDRGEITNRQYKRILERASRKVEEGLANTSTSMSLNKTKVIKLVDDYVQAYRYHAPDL